MAPRSVLHIYIRSSLHLTTDTGFPVRLESYMELGRGLFMYGDNWCSVLRAEPSSRACRHANVAYGLHLPAPAANGKAERRRDL